MTAQERAAELRKHIAGTYFSLRMGIAAIGILLPIILIIAGAKSPEGLRGSISDYYHEPVRDVFVGALISVGVALYLYKGFSTTENVALNLAGAFITGVALFPTAGTKHPGSPLHVP